VSVSDIGQLRISILIWTDGTFLITSATSGQYVSICEDSGPCIWAYYCAKARCLIHEPLKEYCTTCGGIIIIKTLAELFERCFQGQLRGEVINTTTTSKTASSTVQEQLKSHDGVLTMSTIAFERCQDASHPYGQVRLIKIPPHCCDLC
jgi:hypothetical protein